MSSAPSYYRDRPVRLLFWRDRVVAAPGSARARGTPSGAEREGGSWLVCTKERFQDRSPARLFMHVTRWKENISVSIRKHVSFAREARGVPRASRQLTHPPYKKPELLATASQSSSGGCGHYQAARTREVDLFLTVYCDLVFLARYVTGWMVAMRESAELAKRLDRRESCQNSAFHRASLLYACDADRASR